MDNTLNAADRLRALFVDKTLPGLLTHAWDTARGGVIEKLSSDFSTAPYTFRRSMLHARQLFLYSHWSVRLGDDRYARAADDVFAYLMAHHHDTAQGGWFDSVDLDGRVRERSKHLYSMAFVIFGLSTYGHVLGRQAAIPFIDEALAFLDRTFAIGDGLYHTKIDADGTATTPVALQNPHMHLFEALLQLHATSGRADVLARATALFDAVKRTFVRDGMIIEQVPYGTSPADDVPVIVEPGHQAEWAWLVAWYSDLRGGDAALREFGRGLYTHAVELGWDDEIGGVFDEVDPDTRAVVTDTKRFWPILELIKATHVHGTPDSGPSVDVLVDFVLTNYLQPNGLWIERRTRQMRVVPGDAPVSSGYHLGLAVSEITRP